MRRLAALFPIVFALGAIIFAPDGGAQARDSREGPIKITQCQTIIHPGSYELADNLPPTGPSENCLVITASYVSIDLAGFTISGPGDGTTGILAQGQLHGIAVRNGSISNFANGVDLSSADGSIVEGLRVNIIGLSSTGISANGIIKNNTVSGSRFYGITATGIVTGNYAFSNRIANIEVGPGSTVIGNTTTSSEVYGILVGCPSNVADNTATGSSQNLVLQGDGCNNTNNVAP
jgi:hypothetical protein